MNNHYRNKPKDKAPVFISAQDFLTNKNKSKRDKKRKQHKNKRDFTTLAFGINMAEVRDKKRRKKKKRDINEIMYYNYNKMRYYVD